MFKIAKIIEYLEKNEEKRPIAKKYEVIRHFLLILHPRLLHFGTDATVDAMIADALDIDRKIRRAKQLNPHLKGDEEEQVQELEEQAKEDLGYEQTP